MGLPPARGGARSTSRGVVSGAPSDLRRLNVNALAFDAREFSRLSCHVGRHLRLAKNIIKSRRSPSRILDSLQRLKSFRYMYICTYTVGYKYLSSKSTMINDEIILPLLPLLQERERINKRYRI